MYRHVQFIIMYRALPDAARTRTTVYARVLHAAELEPPILGLYS